MRRGNTPFRRDASRLVAQVVDPGARIPLAPMLPMFGLLAAALPLTTVTVSIPDEPAWLRAFITGQGKLEFEFTAPDNAAFLLTRDPARHDVTLNVRAAPSLDGPWTDVAVSRLGQPFVAPATWPAMPRSRA